MKLSVFHFLFFYFFLFIYLFRAANFMHNINIIHIHQLPFLALPVSLPCLFRCPAYFLDLPCSSPDASPIAFLRPFLSLTSLCILHMPTSFCLCLFPLPIHIIILFLYIFFAMFYFDFSILFEIDVYFDFSFQTKCILHR